MKGWITDPELEILFKDLFDKNAKIYIDFCHSGKMPVVIDFFERVANDPEIYGFSAKVEAYGDYSSIKTFHGLDIGGLRLGVTTDATHERIDKK